MAEPANQVEEDVVTLTDAELRVKREVLPPRQRLVLDNHLTREELSADFALSVETLARWESQKIGPICFRIGLLVWYPIDHLKNWLNDKANDALTARERHTRSQK